MQPWQWMISGSPLSLMEQKGKVHHLGEKIFSVMKRKGADYNYVREGALLGKQFHFMNLDLPKLSFDKLVKEGYLEDKGTGRAKFTKKGRELYLEVSKYIDVNPQNYAKPKRKIPQVASGTVPVKIVNEEQVGANNQVVKNF